MISMKKALAASLSMLLIIACTANMVAMQLSQFNYGAASVLPVYTFKGKKYGILSREAHGNDKGTYDDFGGKRDKGEKDSLITAAREWMEEGLVTQVTGLTFPAIRNLIDIGKKANKTECIVAYTGRISKNVTYITDVSQYKDQLLYGFYGALKKAIRHENKEKDSIAVVDLSELTTVLRNAMNQNQHKVTGITTPAFVLNQKTNKLEKGVITLRPFFVSKLRPHFLKWPSVAGKNKNIMTKKIKFYFFNMRPAVRPSWGNWFKSFVVKPSATPK